MLVDELKNLVDKESDLSDVGNEIGVIISRYLSSKGEKVTQDDIDLFFMGFNHGVDVGKQSIRRTSIEIK
jgi:hypothetical protein